MEILGFSLLIIATIIFYMLEVSFKSFSRISLAGFLEDHEEKIKILQTFDFVKKYEMVLNAFQAFSFFLQLGLFIYSYILLAQSIPTPIHRILILIFSFLFLFNFFLYMVVFSKKEIILKTLIPLTPLPWIFFFPANIIFSAFVNRVPEFKENEADDLSEKGLEVFIEEGTREGVLETEDKEMIESIIDFGDTLVKEVITPRVDMIYVNMSIGLEELVSYIKDKKKSRLPVISERIDNIEGIILAKDVFDYWTAGDTDFHIKKIIRPAFFIPETMRVFKLLKEFQKSKQKFAIVSDEFGGVSGIVTMEDIVEEIVGEIHDEYDYDTENIVKEKDFFVVKGDTDVYDLNDTLEAKLDEDEDYQTVAGLMSFKLGKIPRKGDSITFKDYIFEVIEVQKNRVKKVKIKKM